MEAKQDKWPISWKQWLAMLFALPLLFFLWGSLGYLGLLICIVVSWKRRHLAFINSAIIFTVVINILLFSLCFGVGGYSFILGHKQLSTVARHGVGGQNLNKKWRVYPSHSGGIRSPLGIPVPLVVDLGKRWALLLLGPGDDAYTGSYPTQNEAQKLLAAGQTSDANNIKELNKTLKIHPNTINAIVSYVGRLHHNHDLVGHLPSEIRIHQPNSSQRSIQWAHCGKNCMVVSPMLSRRSWKKTGEFIFLVDTKHSIIFAQYRSDKFWELP